MTEAASPESTAEKVTVERRGHLLLIGLNRPDKLNAFDPEMIGQLARAYTLLAKDRELRCGVLWARGRYFTSGLDLAAIVKHMPREFFSPIIPRGTIDPWGITTEPCPKPIVTAVQGRCFTLGIELLLCGQVTIASEDAIFTQYEVNRGLFPFGGGTVRWPLAVGTQNAYRYLLTGEDLDAAEALRIGLVQRVVSAEHCLPAAIEMAQKIAANAPLGVQAVLRNSRLSQSKGVKTALRKLRWQFLRLILSKDARRGVAAFKARTTAEFKGD
ncbi:MAG: crotonase/enoyl-CoA hydratase family protein [Nevskiales bacterium]